MIQLQGERLTVAAGQRIEQSAGGDPVVEEQVLRLIAARYEAKNLLECWGCDDESREVHDEGGRQMKRRYLTTEARKEREGSAGWGSGQGFRGDGAEREVGCCADFGIGIAQKCGEVLNCRASRVPIAAQLCGRDEAQARSWVLEELCQRGHGQVMGNSGPVQCPDGMTNHVFVWVGQALEQRRDGRSRISAEVGELKDGRETEVELDLVRGWGRSAGQYFGKGKDALRAQSGEGLGDDQCLVSIAPALSKAEQVGNSRSGSRAENSKCQRCAIGSHPLSVSRIGVREPGAPGTFWEPLGECDQLRSERIGLIIDPLDQVWQRRRPDSSQRLNYLVVWGIILGRSQERNAVVRRAASFDPIAQGAVVIARLTVQGKEGECQQEKRKADNCGQFDSMLPHREDHRMRSVLTKAAKWAGPAGLKLGPRVGWLGAQQKELRSCLRAEGVHLFAAGAGGRSISRRPAATTHLVEELATNEHGFLFAASGRTERPATLRARCSARTG